MKQKLLSKISLLMVTILSVGSLAMPVGAAGDTSPNVIPSRKPQQQTEEIPEKPKTTNPYDIPFKNLTALYTAPNGKFMVSPIRRGDADQEKFAELISSINDTKKETAMDEHDAVSSIEASFLLIHSDGRRIIYTLNKNNRIQANGGDIFTIPADTYTSLLNMYKKDRKDVYYPQWLIYMKPKAITEVTIQTSSDKQPVVIPPGYLNPVTQAIRGLRVIKGESYGPKNLDLVAGNGTTAVTLHFGEDSKYTLFIKGDTLEVHTELRIACKYTLAPGEGKRLVEALSNPSGAFVSDDKPSVQPIETERGPSTTKEPA